MKIKKQTSKVPEIVDLPLASSADALLAVDDRPEKKVNIPEWGFSVMVRPIDAKTAALISRSVSDEKGSVDGFEYMARTILEGVTKPRLGPQHLEMLKAKSNDAFVRLFNEIAGKKKEPSSN